MARPRLAPRRTCKSRSPATLSAVACYQGLLAYQRRRAVTRSDRDQPATTKMKKVHCSCGCRIAFGVGSGPGGRLRSQAA